MAQQAPSITEVDPVWTRITQEADAAIEQEPLMGSLIHAGVLHHDGFSAALAYRLAMKLASREMSEQILRETLDAAYTEAPEMVAAARADLVATFDRDPACHRLMQPLLFFKGFQAFHGFAFKKAEATRRRAVSSCQRLHVQQGERHQPLFPHPIG